MSFRETAHAIQTNSLVGLDEWDGQERKVVCREEEQVQKEEKVKEDEAQEAGGGTSEPRTASMCVIVSY